ncbi:ArnT family glycosyltransferase [Arcobacter porcinus]|uniref:PMT family membrane protein n=1 Tax=Arcobacter porcinus TaxID=1935204 RepID=A0A5C2HKR9_9BACT|nr:glycosyltransferase family 39 protein [Arcobacter porcinus]OCL90703.1 hypothetical protein AAX27_01514 [Aliarcobacter thereius]QEP40858.1 PMT family membrane protein [Arcobacter porcinus]
MFSGFFKSMIKSENIHISLFPLLILVFLWTYGYIGALTKSSLGLQIVITSCLIGLLLFLFFIYEKYISKNRRIDTIVISKNDIKLVLLILPVVLLLGSEYMFFSLVNDELSHSQSSQFHAIYGLQLLADRLPSFIVEQKASLLVWIIASFVLIGSIVLIYYINKWNFKYKYIVISILFLLFFRAAYILLGGLDPSHPPFRLFPLWLSSTIFSLSNFSFRLPGVIGLSLIGLIIYKVLKPKIRSSLLLWLSVFTLISIPLLWHTSYIVEPSIWAALFSTLFLLTFQADKLNKFSFFTWFLLLAVFILMRQSLAFIALPMLFVFVMERKSLLFKNWKETIVTLSPLLVVLPFLIRSIILGTPAQASTDTEVQWTLLEKLYNVISSGMLKDIILNNFEIWSIFILFAFVPTKNNRVRYFITILLFTISAFIVFYSIRPVLWGQPRYQAEYLIPLIILGAVRFLTILFDGKYKISKYLVSIALLSLLTYNLYTITISHAHKDMTVNGNSVIAHHSVYDYEAAFRIAKENGYAGSTATLGVTYGIMNEVLYGYTLSEIKKQAEFHKEFNYFKDIDIDSLAQNQNIKLVMLSDMGNRKESIRTELINNGFKEWKRFSNENTTDEIIALVRNNKEETK